MVETALNTWKKDLNAVSKQIVGAADLQSLTSLVTKAYRVSQRILRNCITKRKLKRAILLRKRLQTYFSTCHSVKQNLPQETQEDSDSGYKCVMAAFLSHYIDVTMLSNDITAKEQRMIVTVSLFWLLGLKEEKVIEAVLNAKLSDVDDGSTVIAISKRILREPIPEMTCSHYVKLALLAKKSRSTVENADLASELKKMLSRHEFPQGMEYFLRNKLGPAFPLLLPVEQKKLKKFLRKIDDESADILQKKLCQIRLKKLLKKTSATQPVVEDKKANGNVQLPEKSQELFFIDVGKKTNEDDVEEEEEEAVDLIHDELDALIHDKDFKFDERLTSQEAENEMDDVVTVTKNVSAQEENEQEDGVSSSEEEPESVLASSEEEEETNKLEDDVSSSEEKEENKPEDVITLKEDKEIGDTVSSAEEVENETNYVVLSSEEEEEENKIEDVITLKEEKETDNAVPSSEEEEEEEESETENVITLDDEEEKQPEDVVISEEEEEEVEVPEADYKIATEDVTILESEDEVEMEEDEIHVISSKENRSTVGVTRTDSPRKKVVPLEQTSLEISHGIAEVSSTTDIVEVENAKKSQEVEFADDASSSSSDESLLKTSQRLSNLKKTPIKGTIVKHSVRKDSNSKETKRSKTSETTDVISPSEVSSGRKRHSDGLKTFVTPDISLTMDDSTIESPDNVFVTPESAKKSTKRLKVQLSKVSQGISEKHTLEAKSESAKKVVATLTYSKATPGPSKRSVEGEATPKDLARKTKPSNRMQPVVKLTKLRLLDEGKDSISKKETAIDSNTPARRAKRTAKSEVLVTLKTPKRNRSSTPKRKPSTTADKRYNLRSAI